MRKREHIIDVAKSDVKWHAKKVTGEHYGTISLNSGHVDVQGNKVVDGTFTFEMNSIAVTDIKDPEYNQKLVGHLKSDDFFSADKNPTAAFKITGVKPVASAKADVTIDRSKFDIRYGSRSFFDNLGDKAIYDEFVVTLDVTASRSTATAQK